ncbi:MAG: glutathione S-transferase family protein [Roseicyclus sp.]|nr:glutathione S-transferase family protein [Roseicyclus sp.]
MADLILYTHPMSRGRIARWMMEEAGRPYEARIVNYGAEMKGAQYRAINPLGKVPSLVHGDMVVTEGAAICAYMADLAVDARLAPPIGTPERGVYYRWLFFGAGPLEAGVVAASFGFDTKDDTAYSRAGWGSLPAVVDALEGLFADGRDYVLGEHFSAVDVYLGAQIAWGLQFGTIETRPGFADYVTRITTRPAAIRAAEIDDALLAEAQKDGA